MMIITAVSLVLEVAALIVVPVAPWSRLIMSAHRIVLLHALVLVTPYAPQSYIVIQTRSVL